MMMRLVVVILFVLGSGVAYAQEPENPPETAEEREARELYDQGLTHYELAEYDQAILFFKASYKISKAPLLLYNIAQAYRLKGDCAQALTFYKNYVRLEPNAPNRVKVDQRIAEMEACIAKQGETVVPPDDVKKEPLDKEKIDLGVKKDPGAGPGGPPVVDRPAGRPGRVKKVAGAVTAGLGIAAVATGVWFGLSAMDAEQQVAELLDMPGVVDWTADLEAAEARGARDEKLAIGFMTAGGVAIVGGAVLYWLGAREAKAGSSAPAPVTVIPSRGGASVAWSFSF